MKPCHLFRLQLFPFASLLQTSDNMMKCRGIVNEKECGNVLPDEAKFCPECGTAASSLVAFDCPCGVTVRGNHKFCFNCGSPVRLADPKDSTSNVCCAKLPDGSVCGFTLIQGLNFCPSCGTRTSLKEDQQVSSPPDKGAAKDECTAVSPTASSSTTQNQTTDRTDTLGESKNGEFNCMLPCVVPYLTCCLYLKMSKMSKRFARFRGFSYQNIAE
eukprot:GHVL01028600.1.p1 GENE.GHVL01028600.1~~GHVL01028600.1.p1  ORF type:complete len:215 (-),score=13.32 GHVL01028600.1:210-854(-)